MTRARDVANLIGSGNYSSTTFTATAGQTAFTISHTQGFIQVFMNGLLLDETVDYTSNGSAVTLTSGAAAGDEIEVVAYNTFSVGDALNQAAADTRYVNTTGGTMTGSLEVEGSTTDTIALKYSGTSGGHNSSYLFKDFRGQINAGIKNNLQDDGVGSAASHLGLYTATGGTLTKQMEITRYGYVTKPNQPSFNAYRNTSLTTNTGGAWTLVPDWTGTRFNNSSSFNTSNGRFTAPVAGEYLFGVTNNMGSSHNVKSWRLYVNGAAWLILSYADVTASWQNLSGFALVTLNASDYVQFAYRGQPDYGNDWLNVYGYLMG